MKRSEMLEKIRKMDKKALGKRISALRVEIVKKHVEVSTGKEKASSKLRMLKKELARALTLYKTAKNTDDADPDAVAAGAKVKDPEKGGIDKKKSKEKAIRDKK